MSDLIDREHVIDFLKLTRDSEYEKSMSAEVKHKSVIRSKHDAHVAFCDYLIEYVNQVPTHPTPSNTLGALDCIDRQEAIKALCREECGMDPKGCRVGTCYDVEIIEDVPSVQLELSNNSPELDNKNGELISRQEAKEALRERLKRIPTYAICAMAVIEDLPSVQSEIIRCKDCKYHEECCRTIRSYGRSDDDFCSCAELRRDEAKEGGDKGC